MAIVSEAPLEGDSYEIVVGGELPPAKKELLLGIITFSERLKLFQALAPPPTRLNVDIKYLNRATCSSKPAKYLLEVITDGRSWLVLAEQKKILEAHR